MRILQVRTLADLAAAYAETTQFAERCFARDGRVTASAVFFPRRGMRFAANILGPDDASRARTLQAFALKAIAENVVAAVIAAETWVVEGWPEPEAPSRSSDRRFECLNVVAQMRHPATGKLVFQYGSRRIQRHSDGRASLSGDCAIRNVRPHFLAPFDFLPHRRPNAEERAAARAALGPIEEQMREDRRFALAA